MMTYYTQRFLLVSLLLLIGASASLAQAGKFTLQVEATNNLTPAVELVQQLKSSGVDAYYLKSEVPGKGLFYRVRVGNFTDQTAAQEKGEQLRRAQLIKDYYVARYEGGAYQNTATPTPLAANRTLIANLTTKEFEANDPTEADDETVVDSTPNPTQKKPSKSRPVHPPVRPRHVTVIRQGGVITGVGDVPIKVPFENDDIMGSCYLMPNGSVMTAATSMGVFTARDQVLGAIIPYAGTEAKLKFKAGVEQGWTPPHGVIAADLMKMDVNPAGYREFQAASDPLKSFGITGGKIMFHALRPGEYMIRGRTGNGKCVFLPLSVREDCCTANVR